MPHENVWSTDSTPEQNNRVQVAWGPAPDGVGDGHVMIVVERPDGGLRSGGSVNATREGLTELFADAAVELANAYDSGKIVFTDAMIERLMVKWGPNLAYAFGMAVDLLTVQIDRDGCNRLIRATRKGRDVAFGADA